MSAARTLAVLALGLGMAACSGLGSRNIGLQQGHLKPCPSAPHCVSSEVSDERHALAPLLPVDASSQAWAKILVAVAATERTTIVESDGHYLHAEVLSPWHFYTDDLELLFRPDQGRVEVRSSSRVGYYDFNVNRKRVEILRARLIELGLVRR